MRSMSSPLKQVAIFLVGAPGTGKSTVARKLTARLGYGLFLSGQALRRIAKEEPHTPMGREVGERLGRNESMPIDLYCEVVGQALRGHAHTGLVIDGYPRTADQCLAIPSVLRSAGLPHATVIGIALHASTELSIDRISKRSVCPACGGDDTSPQRCCDTGSRSKRTDDAPGNTVIRLARYRDTAPAIAEVFARSWHYADVDASGHLDDVMTGILRAVAEFEPVSLASHAQVIHERG